MSRIGRSATWLAAAFVVWTGGCAGGSGEPGAAETEARLRRSVEAAMDRITAHADSMDHVLHPVPLLSSPARAALRRYSNADQLERARLLGVRRPQTNAAVDSLVDAGRLTPLGDNALWIVRELDHSRPLLTPDARALLQEIARRFQARLDSMGLPPLRLEVTSAFRSAASQADLRTTNPNAARTVSTHEFGTTFDLAYSAFAAPAPAAAVDTVAPAWLRAHLERVAGLATETVAARRSRELQAVLGHVLLGLQEEGRAMVRLERQQPVYHVTVARRLGEG